MTEQPQDYAELKMDYEQLKQELAEVQQQKAQYEFIFYFNPNPMLVFDSALNIINVNQAYLDATGWSKEKTLSSTVSALQVSDQKGEGLREAVRDKQEKSAAATFVFPTGTFRWIQHCIPVLNKAGELEKIFTVYNDITKEAKQLEEVAALQERAAAVIDSCPYPTILWRPDMTVEGMNQAGKDMLNIRASDLTNVDISSTFEYLSQTGISVNEVLRQRVGGKGEATIRVGDKIKYVERHNLPLFNAEKELINVLTFYYEQTLQKMAVNEVIEISKAAEEGDLTARADSEKFTGDYYDLANGINQVLETLVGSFNLIKDLMGGLAADAEEVTASIKEVSVGTASLAENADAVGRVAAQGDDGVKQILQAMEDLTTTVSEIAVRSEAVAKSATAAEDKSKNGVELAKKTETAMNGINQNTSEVDQIVQDIKAQMDQIGKIVNVITDIANQTNLLALNAAIEAARAGDAGRGFAVVASEVKSLAEDSRKSAENIAEMIHTLQTKTELASDAVSETGNSVREGNEALAETLEAFNTITEGIEEITKNVTEVASLSEEQAASVEEVTASIQEVSNLLQLAAKQAVDSAASTEEAAAAISQIDKAMGDVAVKMDQANQELVRLRTE